MNDLILVCETCRFPVTGDTGSLYVRLADIHEHRDAQRLWDLSHPAGEPLSVTDFLLHPRKVRWRTGHDACRADRDTDCYEIDAPQIATWQDVARWTAHLMAKNWFTMSDWASLLRELSGETPAVRIRVVAREAA